MENMVLNNDGVTYRYAGEMQRPMSVAEQKAAGLVAQTNRSISGREVKTGPSR